MICAKCEYLASISQQVYYKKNLLYKEYLLYNINKIRQGMITLGGNIVKPSDTRGDCWLRNSARSVDHENDWEFDGSFNEREEDYVFPRETATTRSHWQSVVFNMWIDFDRTRSCRDKRISCASLSLRIRVDFRCISNKFAFR